MDVKLFLRILAIEVLTVLVLAIVVKVIFAIPGTLDLIFWFCLALLHSVLVYRGQINAGDKLGIAPNTEHYLKTDFFGTLNSQLTEEQLIERIKSAKGNLGKVYVNRVLVRKQKFKGVANMSRSDIRTLEEGDRKSYVLTTCPSVPLFKMDEYTNYKCFTSLKAIISGAKQD